MKRPEPSRRGAHHAAEVADLGRFNPEPERGVAGGLVPAHVGLVEAAQPGEVTQGWHMAYGAWACPTSCPCLYIVEQVSGCPSPDGDGRWVPIIRCAFILQNTANMMEYRFRSPQE